MHDQARIREVLPHRHPILLVDRVDEIVHFESLTAVKAVTGSEPCYADMAETAQGKDFAYPASLILESFCQAGAFLWLESMRAVDRRLDGKLVFALAKDVAFHLPVYPGDTLRHELRMDRVLGDNAFLSGRIRVGDAVVAEVGSLAAAIRRAADLDGPAGH
ncbi:MAG: beta-hydroxyacyl-(acyl-carrier-protein) dehydratase, FabA/FabZ [Amycolatopsis sp.]|uniref:3-hydroxyacyl-ACP dehydratase FabZ family protein n=1 Tax=Amycolatopsis sp. TaxID=37632 RepID=UPI00260F49C8|nr:beta-hydroxyacyl-ACP dehydratase [Amycolatopsis sp.]MCU1681793.1 beta-hydroxyacyl-(acyl-carrier-protein) dehydratase, FabA/FabZ [Amycolatopsis sp.]